MTMTITDPVGFVHADESMRSRQVEAWLDSFGVDWEFVVMPLDRIDDLASMQNQARFAPKDADLVDQYALAAAGGAVFPPLVVARAGKRVVTLDGNHRRWALSEAGYDTHPAYVVDAPAEVRDLMAFAANTMNGRPRTDAETRAMVLKLAARKTFTHRQIANLVGCTEARVSVICRAADARARATDRRAAERVQDEALVAAGRASSDEVLDVLIANQVSAMPLSPTDVAKVATVSNKQRTDAGRLDAAVEALALAKEAKVSPKGKRRTMTDAAKLNNAVGSILNCTVLNVALECQDRADTVARIDAAVDHLGAIRKGIL